MSEDVFFLENCDFFTIDLCHTSLLNFISCSVFFLSMHLYLPYNNYKRSTRYRISFYVRQWVKSYLHDHLSKIGSNIQTKHAEYINIARKNLWLVTSNILHIVAL